MSVESWTRRVSGLLVPTLGFSNKLGHFQPCVGPCCEYGEESGDCPYCDGSPLYIEVTISGASNNLCTACANLDGTYLSYYSNTCGWTFPSIGHIGCQTATAGLLAQITCTPPIVPELVVVFACDGTSMAYYVKGLSSTDCLSWADLVLSLTWSDNRCSMPASITVTAV